MATENITPGIKESRPTNNRIAPPSILRRWGSQLGIIGVGLVMWLCFVIAAPAAFTNADIYVAFAETTPVFDLVEHLVRDWGEGARWEHRGDNEVKEAHFLTLDSHQAARHLGWKPVWQVAAAVRHSVAWYRGFLAGDDMVKASLAEIDRHIADVAS